MTMFRAELKSISARQLWDGRVRPGSPIVFVPGVIEFRRGVQRLHELCGSEVGSDAEVLLQELLEELERAEVGVDRWNRGMETFIKQELGGACPDDRTWVRGRRKIRPWHQEMWRLGLLIARYDAAVVLTSNATASARRIGILNPHHLSIAQRYGWIRQVILRGYRGVGLRAGRGSAVAP